MADLPAKTSSTWAALRRHTTARIGLGRSGGSLPHRALLDFRGAHARARDAVHSTFDAAQLAADLRHAGLDSLTLASAATDRATYLRRPDLGRQLDPVSATQLRERVAARPDLVIIVSDGLSATAAHRQAVATVAPLHAALSAAGWTLAPILLVPFARVKLQDEIGHLLQARLSLMLLGERPGLGAPDSLGAYFTHAPHPRCTDADRNCLSNIRPAGLPPTQAARKLAALLQASREAGLSGVRLKDTSQPDALESAE
ncbi:ethanolamine ammonia-lyase subunit EutC [Actomonas aquatica]|uniref:Ethanolamine ammonia-lyase small subunit n=1 Tax=Actomonas aquatica TaxID=2866162 RepID=A0ABZ1C1X1_9BACT|nr:ethanolamine ammonia-lyase subunit EutC [Opitutus sp. WL0086]WRQ85647.1 ethanolamine ammonia-lyase subunit EutC [Opitutus sp. WL0086]